jgi:3-oxoacyl-[acyl-carrier protein] reductase
MELNLGTKNVLVTGSSRGIGAGIAQAFANEGSKLLLNARNDFTTTQLKVIADVRETSGVQALANGVMNHFGGKLDVLVCNVGSGKSVPPGQESSADWKNSFEVNFFSATNVIETLLPFMGQNGSIICVSSICGLEHFGAPLTYSAAKAALNSYVVGLSKVIGKKGLRINAIAPGNILFEGSVWDRKLQENPSAVSQMLEKEVALSRLGRTEEVSNVALFLSSEKASFITGSIVVVDGGQVRSW